MFSTAADCVLLVVEYVPAAAKFLGVKEGEAEQPTRESPPGPPERPHHDEHIEEFVREQHLSKADSLSVDK